MKMKGDAKFEGELTRVLKNDIRNLVNFDASSGKSENLHFDIVLYLSIAYNIKFQLKQYKRIFSHDTGKRSKL